ncbi:AAA family ATPase [Candidatus Laterigemmans baculatus]|uniref:AAA family ATPase n=1 Tax=Candidatus Laterigemmans baculatus TaxID=2770505 RepID=UPI0013DC9483|nr:AAA family ATPase [Candidatus Laterigemmans baculatus]
MSTVLRLAIVDPHDNTRESLKTMLMGMEMVWLEAECSRYEFFPDVIRETAPDIGVVSLDSNPEQAIELVRRLSSEVPGTILLVASSHTDGQLILRSMRAGAREFLTLPITAEELGTALERVGATKFASGDGKSRTCQVISVAGATGGVGSTSIAVNLGCMLASQPGNSVALVDLDLALGDADVFLDSIPDYTLADVSQSVSRLDIQLLKRSLTKHQTGLYLLPRPVELQDSQMITAEGMHKVLGLLKASFTHLIIDLSKTYSAIDMTALELSNHVILISQLDLPCLRNVVRLLMSFDEIEGLKEKVQIVVNRADLESGQISLKKAKETIGRDIFAQLPNDYRTMVEVRNNGVPLVTQAPKAAITQALRDLIVKLIGNPKGEGEEPEEAEKVATGGWRKFWPGQKSS